MGDKKFRRLSAFFSFALPGLGQVYQRRYLAGAIFFLTFICLATVSAAHLLLPLLAAIAGLETRRFLSPTDPLALKAQWPRKFEEKYSERVQKSRTPLFTI